MERQQRSDAVRNRARILETAREQVAVHGPDVSMEEIARAAEVAVGTLYRHYPTKADLVLAALDQHVTKAADEIEAALDRVSGGGSAAREVQALLLRSAAPDSEHRMLKEVARLSGADPSSSDAMVRLATLLDRFVAQGQAAGEIRPDITSSDIYLLMSTMPTELSGSARRRWAELVLPGIVGT